MSWYVDEGISKLIKEWKVVHPNAVVGTIADSSHSTDPDVSQHAPDTGGSAPGDDKGEVDAADFMPGNGVTETDLDELFLGLLDSRDKRILYVIQKDDIFSSVVQPWRIRKYSGEYHKHVHVSVNDNYDNNQSDWRWEKLVARTVKYAPTNGTLPEELMYGDEDASTFEGRYHHVVRAQVLANWYERKLPSLDLDGVYGAKSAQKFAKIFGGNGKKLTLANLKQLHGIS